MLLFIVCCLLVFYCAGCNGGAITQNGAYKHDGPITVDDDTVDIIDAPDTSGAPISNTIITDRDDVEAGKETEGTTVPLAEDVQVLSNMYNQINRPSGQVHYYNGKTLFQMSDGTYLSDDYGQTMRKVFADIMVYTYKEKVYILREDGIYLSDYEGQLWEKLSGYTPDMAAEYLYPGKGYDAHVNIAWEDKLFFRIGGVDEYGGLYSINIDGTNAKELIGRVSRNLIDGSDTLIQYSYWYTKDGIYYSDYDTGVYRMDYDGKNKELVFEMAKISDCIIYGTIIYYSKMPYGAVYAYDMESKSIRKIFNEEAALDNITPQGLILNTYKDYAPGRLVIYSFTAGQLEVITDDYYRAVFVAGSKIFGHNEDEERYILLN
jgi:hypothetical protein